MSDGRTTLGVGFALYLSFTCMAVYGFITTYWGTEEDGKYHFGLWKFCTEGSCEAFDGLEDFSDAWQIGKIIMCIAHAGLAITLICFIWWIVEECRECTAGRIRAGTGAVLSGMIASSLIIMGSILCVTQFDQDHMIAWSFVITAIAGSGLFFQTTIMIPCVRNVTVERPPGLQTRHTRRARPRRSHHGVTNIGYNSTADDPNSNVESRLADDAQRVNPPAYSESTIVTSLPSVPPLAPALFTLYGQPGFSDVTLPVLPPLYEHGTEMSTLANPPSYEDATSGVNKEPKAVVQSDT